jgi:hypothetical protein
VTSIAVVTIDLLLALGHLAPLQKEDSLASILHTIALPTHL